jgi:hypothetical protein
MSSHRAAFRFRAGGFDLKAEAFGRRWDLERDGRRVTLSLPLRPDSFGSSIDALTIGTWTRIGEGYATASDEGRVVAALGAFEVSVDVEVDISSADPNPEDHLDEIERGQKAVDLAFPTALSVAADFISWLRVQMGRYWLPPSHEAPDVLEGWLIEASSGRSVRNVSFNPVIHLKGLGRNAGLTVEELDQVAESLAGGAAPSTPEVLLADARETLSTPSVEHEWQAARRDIRRAILLAAIAAEVQIKTTLDDKTPTEKKALVNIILKSFREVEVAVGELPHKTMKAAVGRSLHEDDPELFRAIKKLFTHRNHVAHRGEPPSLEEARTDIQAAVRLFSWLDSLPDPA